MKLIDNHQELHHRAYADLTQRAKGGISIYLGAWLVLAYFYRLPDSQPTFFYVHTSILIFLFMVRLLHLNVDKREPDISVTFLSRWLIASILFAAFHWGLLTAWVMYDDSFAEMRYTLLIISVAFVIGGPVTLSISRVIRRWYPLLLLGPVILVFLLVGGEEYMIFTVLCLFALFYEYGAAKTTSTDYWQAITSQLLAEERASMMEHLSITDQLTQLHNRLGFDIQCKAEWNRSIRNHLSLSILMIDLDHFKSFNDSYGHSFGDECLQLVARALDQSIHRATDYLARFGGEEFVVVLPNTDAAGAMAVAKRLLLAVSSVELQFNDERMSITCSIGGASILPDRSSEMTEILNQADSALYQAKHNGRNQYAAFTQGKDQAK